MLFIQHNEHSRRRVRYSLEKFLLQFPYFGHTGLYLRTLAGFGTPTTLLWLSGKLPHIWRQRRFDLYNMIGFYRCQNPFIFNWLEHQYKLKVDVFSVTSTTCQASQLDQNDFRSAFPKYLIFQNKDHIFPQAFSLDKCSIQC